MTDVATRDEVTGLLEAWRHGNRRALESLFPLLEGELHRIARGCMAGQPADHTLQPTALVNEVYLRLAGARSGWQDRSHFLAACSQVMRRILVDHARARLAAKRGGGANPAVLEERWVAVSLDRDTVAVDDGLDSLAAFDQRKAQVVELRFFGGLSVEETAAALGVSAETVKRDWKIARLWLAREMVKEEERPRGPRPMEND